MKYLLKNVNLLDGNIDENQQMSVRKNVTIAVEDGKIAGIYDAGNEPAGYSEGYDLTGKYLMPGLINLHVHLPASGKPPKANAKPKNYKAIFDLLTKYPLAMKVFLKMEKDLAKKHLYSGVTTMRTVGGVLDHDAIIRDTINAGRAEGPRMLVCNTAISVPGGHFAGSLATEARTPEEAVRHVEQIAATNPDWIKLMITGGVMDSSVEGEPGVLRMAPEMVKAACDKAHELGYKVAAHVECPEGVLVALENGVDTIEHGAIPDEKMISLFRERNAMDVCTISPALPYVRLPEEISHCGDIGRKNGRIVVHGIIECAKVCLDNGIPVGLGTDAGSNFITPYEMWRELVYFVTYMRVTPAFALHTATAVNAKILGLENEIGTVECGKCADFLVCDSNPLESFGTMRQPAMVVARGRVINKPKLKKRRNIEDALDKCLKPGALDFRQGA